MDDDTTEVDGLSSRERNDAGPDVLPKLVEATGYNNSSSKVTADDNNTCTYISAVVGSNNGDVNSGPSVVMSSLDTFADELVGPDLVDVNVLISVISNAASSSILNGVASFGSG
ncbi:hypothetical protein Tco_0813885 [Tanacetum coccineum]